MLRCPKCRGAMNEREARGHYGAILQILQCPECLGLWVDGTVVTALSHDSALQAESDVDFSEISTEPRQVAAFCPRCEIYLMEQTGGGLPKDLRIDYCKGCHGFWFDKGELMIYKSYIEKKRKKFSAREKGKRKKRALESRLPATQAGMVLRFLSSDASGYFL